MLCDAISPEEKELLRKKYEKTRGLFTAASSSNVWGSLAKAEKTTVEMTVETEKTTVGMTVETASAGGAGPGIQGRQVPTWLPH